MRDMSLRFSLFFPMFHVEHMKNYTMSLIILALGLAFSGCRKEDPNPELADKIYQDLKTELEIAKKNTQAERDQFAKVSEELSQVVPQSGVRKFAERRVFMSEKQLDVYLQQEKYFEVKLEQRRIFVQKRYLESLLPGGRAWPDLAEQKEYEIRLKLRRAKLDWDKKNVPRGTASAKDAEKASEH